MPKVDPMSYRSMNIKNKWSGRTVEVVFVSLVKNKNQKENHNRWSIFQNDDFKHSRTFIFTRKNNISLYKMMQNIIMNEKTFKV